MKARTQWYGFACTRICLIALTLSLGAGLAHAKKPVKPPPPDPEPAAEGWVYVAEAVYSTSLWRMDAGGGAPELQEATLPEWDEQGTTHRDFSISHGAYGGDYWVFYFDVIGTDTYPDGLPRREVFAQSVSGGTRVQITNDEDFQFTGQARIAISPDDGQLAFNGIHETTTNDAGDLEPSAAGIHAVDLAWSTGVPVPSTTRTLLAPIECWISESWVSEENPDYPESSEDEEILVLYLDDWAAPLRDLDWSGDGTQLVAGRVTAQGEGVYVTVITPGANGATEDFLVEGVFPRWSPTDDVIAFNVPGLSAVQSDGTGSELLVGSTSVRNKTTSADFFAAWSVDGKQIAFTLKTKTKRATTRTLAIYDVASGDVLDTEATLPGANDAYLAQILAWRPALPE